MWKVTFVVTPVPALDDNVPAAAGDTAAVPIAVGAVVAATTTNAAA